MISLPLGRTQHGGDETARAVEHDDRLKAVFIVIRVEQTQLLAAMHRVERVVDIERDTLGNLVKRLAVEVHHGTAQAQQGARIGQVFQPRDRRLRTQFAIRRQKIERHLEHGIAAQCIGVVAVFVARRDHQQTKAHDSGERVRDLVRRTRVDQAGCHAIGDAKALLDLAQSQKPAIRRQQTAVKVDDNIFAGNR